MELRCYFTKNIPKNNDNKGIFREIGPGLNQAIFTKQTTETRGNLNQDERGAAGRDPMTFWMGNQSYATEFNEEV